MSERKAVIKNADMSEYCWHAGALRERAPACAPLRPTTCSSLGACCTWPSRMPPHFASSPALPLLCALACSRPTACTWLQLFSVPTALCGSCSIPIWPITCSSCSRLPFHPVCACCVHHHACCTCTPQSRSGSCASRLATTCAESGTQGICLCSRLSWNTPELHCVRIAHCHMCGRVPRSGTAGIG